MVSDKVLLFVVCLVVIGQVTTEKISVENKLVADLMKNYNADTRPRINPKEIITVKMGMALREIIKLNEKQMVLLVNVWMRHEWKDEFLKWNKTKYGGLDTIYLPYHKHWRPDIVLYNNADEKFSAMFNDVVTPVTDDGTVFYIYPAVFRTTCAPNIRYFPFDQQSCKLSFMSWAYHGEAVDLQTKDSIPADTRDYILNSEWGLVKMEVERKVDYYGCCPEPYPSIHFTITIRRRVTPYLFYLIFPNLVINFLTVFQFLLPCDSTERITLGVTIILSLIVHLLLMAEMLPMDEVTPLIGYYFASTIGMVGISLILTFFILHIHFNGLHDNQIQLPFWARHIFLHKLARYTGMQKCITPDSEHENKMHPYRSEMQLFLKPEGSGSESSSDEKITTKASSLLKQASVMNLSSNKEHLALLCILKNMEEFKERLGKQDKEAELKCEWQQLAMVMDRLLFYLYIIVSFFMMVTVFLNRPFYHEQIIK